MTALTPNMLSRLIEGDLSDIEVLCSQPQSVIRTTASLLPTLVLRKHSLKKVLTSLKRKEISPETINTWAWFVRSGYVPSERPPITPIDIEYDPADEDLIVEIMSRLCELGDTIDGEITTEELENFLADLE